LPGNIIGANYALIIFKRYQKCQSSLFFRWPTATPPFVSPQVNQGDLNGGKGFVKVLKAASSQFPAKYGWSLAAGGWLLLRQVSLTK
jgi:hypothetical protein